MNAKTSTHVAALPTGLASGNLEIRDYCRAYKVNRSNDDKRVLGVSYYDPMGHSVDLEGDRVILACYALENARLMLASGINRNGEVGKHLMTHAFGFFMGLTPESSNPFMGPLVASTAIEDFSGELVHDYDPTVLWGAPIISWPGDYQPLEIAQSMPADAPRWGAGFRDWMKHNYTRVWAMYSQTANIPTQETYVDLDPQVKDKYGQPANRMTYGWGEADKPGTTERVPPNSGLSKRQNRPRGRPELRHRGFGRRHGDGNRFNSNRGPTVVDSRISIPTAMGSVPI